MKFGLFKLLVIALPALAFTSCIKDDLNHLGDGGSSFIKITQAPENKIFFTPFTNIQPASLISVRRDVATEAQLQTSVTVKFTTSNDSITKYNTAHNTAYEPLPDSLFTLGSGVTKNGNEYSLTMAPGEFEKDFVINVNGSKYNVTKNYAVAFKISDPAGLKISSGAREAIALISIKNQWDGIYSVVSGYVQRYTAPGTPENPSTLSGTLAGNPDVTLSTVGPNTVEITGHQWTAGSNSSVAGIDKLQATINPTTNLVTMQSLGNATLTNWAGKENKYTPATKTFNLAFRWNPTANVREYEIVLKYKGPR